MYLSQEEVCQFNRVGFIVIRGFFSHREMTQLQVWLQEMQDRAFGNTQEARYYEQSEAAGGSLLVRIENILEERNKRFRDLLINERMSGVLAELLGEAPLLFKEKANYKLPGCRADKLHQDQAAGWNAFTDFFISVGIMVDPNREDNAAISFMDSGNYKKELMTDEWLPLSEDDPPYRPEEEYVLLEGDPGDVVFFDSYVPHGSPPNRSSRSRRNLFLTFNRASAGNLRDRYYDEKWRTYPPNESSAAREAKTFRV